jgi:hypothetical protein
MLTEIFVFVVLFGPSTEIPGWYLNYTRTASFRISDALQLDGMQSTSSVKQPGQF